MLSAFRRTKLQSQSLRSPQERNDLLFDLLNIDLFSSNARREYDDAAVLAAIHKDPRQAKKKHEYSFVMKKGGMDHAVIFNLYPLFLVCCLGGSLEAVQSVYSAFPDAVRERDEDERTCLHWACNFKASTQVISLLITEYPDALKCRTIYGKTPLWVACTNNSCPEIIELLLGAYPKAAQLVDKSSGKTLLHESIRRNVSKEGISLLVEWYPEALKVKDDSGWTPLHEAYDCGAQEEIISSLEQRYPQAKKIADNAGNIPPMLSTRSTGASTHTRHNSDPATYSKRIPSLTTGKKVIREPLALSDTRSGKSLGSGLSPRMPSPQIGYHEICHPLCRNRVSSRPEAWERLTSDTVATEDSIGYGRELMANSLNSLNSDLFEIPLEYLKFCTGDFSDELTWEEGCSVRVFLGKDKILRKKFAVRRLRIRVQAADQGSKKARRVLERNIMKMKNFQHPNVAKLYAYHLSSAVGGDHYLVYELAGNGCLRELLSERSKRERLHWTTRISIASDVAKALEHLHNGQSGEICFHRYLNSASVCVRRDFTALLIDWWVSKIIPSSQQTTGIVTLLDQSGCSAEASLDQIHPAFAQQLKHYSSAHDIFSFGVILVELLTGKIQKDTAILSCYGEGDLVLAADECAGDWDDDILQGSSRLALACLSKSPTNRPKIDDIVKQLGRLAAKSRPWSSGERNSITVLSSAPLVYRLKDTEELHPIPNFPNYRLERELLERCISETRRDIRLIFDNATDDRLQVAAMKRCGCLHFSGHGCSDGLLFEDGCGGAHWLTGNQLFDSVHDHAFSFVYVSACESLFMGQSLVSAGVPHVLCCKQDALLRDDVALKFTLTFYYALCKGYTIEASFTKGKQAVSKRYGDVEVDKFILLPQNGDHDVPLFDAPFVEWMEEKEASSKSFIPPVPRPFLGREVDVYNLIQAQRTRQCINLVGGKGVGCSSLAAAVCHYISERKSTMLDFQNIYFLRYGRKDRGKDVLEGFLRPLQRQLVDEGRIERLNDMSMRSNSVIQSAVAALCETKSLIVFDGVEKTDDENLLDFIDELLKSTGKVKVLITSRCPVAYPSSCSAMSVVNVAPLSTENTAKLFGSVCPHADTLIKRNELLERIVESPATFMEKLGLGFPGDIVNVANTMSLQEYVNLFQAC